MLCKRAVCAKRVFSARAEVGAHSSLSMSTEVTKPPAYSRQGPEPQRFTVASGQMLNVASAALPALLRLGTGALAYGYQVSIVDDDGKYGVMKFSGKKIQESSSVSTFKRPVQQLELYEFEGCPFCKKVREAISILDLDVMIRPCPVNGLKWRPQAISMGGKKQFPFLVDPNTDKQLYESDDIIRYLFNEYGPGEAEIPYMLKAGFLTSLTCGLGLLPRVSKGNRARISKIPEQPLRMWMYDASPFVKIVREVLCELEIPYEQKTVARGSPKRQEMIDTYGHFQVPFMEDPNTGICMFESKDIMEYLEKMYGAN